jgi:hypothetical protein
VNAERLTELEEIVAHGKRSEVIKAGQELIDEIRRLKRPRKAKQLNLFAPLIDDVKAYAKEIGMTSGEAEAFHDYHQARGWTMGRLKIPILDYKAAMRTWKRNGAKFNGESNGNGSIAKRYAIG